MIRRPAPTPVTDAPRRVAIYTRKSTSMGLEQEFNSLDAQREACLSFVKRQHGWSVVDARYDDGGFTGANTDRPAFQRLMADAESGQFDVVVVYKVDRLSRSLLDFMKLMERLNAAGVAFVSVTQNFTTADAMGRLTLNMLMSFAEFEREMIAERTRDKIAMSRRKGKWTGGAIPIGYVTVDKRLVVHELEAVTVRTVFDLFLQHRKTALVARLLNEQQLLPRGRRATPGAKLRWTTASVGHVLRNPIYAGIVGYEGERFRGEHPAIIEEATFERVQRILEGKERVLKFHGFNPEYLLRGMLACALCCKPMTPASTHHARMAYRYYRCTTRMKHGKEACPSAPLSAVSIEQYVVDRIAEAAVDGALAREVQAGIEAKIAKQRSHYELLRAQLPGPIANYAANAARFVEELTRLEGTARALVEARLTTETQRLDAAQRQLSEAERALANLERTGHEVRHVIAALHDFKDVWESMSIPNSGKFLRALIERVLVDEPSARAEIHLIDFAAVDPIGGTTAPESAQEAAA